LHQFFEKKEEVISLRKFGKEHLNEVVEKIKKAGAGRKYDALLGISGGVDSCYVAYVLKNLGIRTLLVHVDNGWNSDDATVNIKTVAKN
jgi:tRNA(Ile)-lysidine synthase TilS/MesJ